VLLVALAATLVYFFGFHKGFILGTRTTAEWAWEAWNPENNQEHSVLILPIALYLIWHARAAIAAAPKSPSLLGLVIVAVGALLFVLAMRALQPRLAIVSLPILIYGSVFFLWGRQVARVFLFPCAFLLFMVPIGGLVQGTVTLQLLVSNVVNTMSSWIGVKIEASGTTIRSMDGSFNFEIAEGCSGIRSLMAMTTLTALYAHFTQAVLWKKVTVFASSIVFAVIGNIGRIFTVILVAKFYDPTFASGLYHDYSGFVFFPIAVAAMVSFSNLLNTDWKALWRWAYYGADPKPLPAPVKGPISYDY
jgi:exosortase